MSFGAVIAKEFRQIRRDPRTLAVLVFVPAILLFLFGYVLSFDVTHIATGVLDLDHSDRSREFTRRLTVGEYFDLREVATTRAALDRAIAEGRVTVAIVIPAGFARAIERGEAASVQALIDGSDGRKATIVQGYLRAFAASFGQRIIAETALRTGQAVIAPVAPEPRVWYNPELKSSLFLVTGLIVFILMITGTISTALSVVRERERGTMEQLLVSPLSAPEVIIGKTVPYLFVAAASTTLLIVVGHGAFGLEIRGSLLLFILAALLFILAALAQGVLISTVTTSQQVAFFAAALSSILPSLLLSGFIFPIAGMPAVIRAITVIVPARYFVSLLRAVMLRGAGFETGLPDLLALFFFSFFLLAVATVRLKRTRLV